MLFAADPIPAALTRARNGVIVLWREGAGAVPVPGIGLGVSEALHGTNIATGISWSADHA